MGRVECTLGMAMRGVGYSICGAVRLELLQGGYRMFLEKNTWAGVGTQVVFFFLFDLR